MYWDGEARDTVAFRAARRFSSHFFLLFLSHIANPRSSRWYCRRMGQGPELLGVSKSVYFTPHLRACACVAGVRISGQKSDMCLNAGKA